MDKMCAKRFVFIVLVVGLAGCSSDPKRIEQQEKALDSQIKFYEVEAQDWRASGNEGMAEYFEQKSQGLRTQRSDLDDGFFDFFIDILFD